ncbi:MAG: EscU/YscU/HrcU family type III secretion system export apparatus switch protein [Methylotenera sp.]
MSDAHFNALQTIGASSKVAPVSTPNQQAIALAYASGDFAPKIVAKGRGLIAEQIIARAKQSNVFVHESKDLVALLMQVDLDDHIPPALYQAIAEILTWLYRLEAAQANAVEEVFKPAYS